MKTCFINTLVSLLGIYMPVAAWAAADLATTSSSPDVTISVGTETVHDEDAVFEDGGTAIEDLGPLVAASDLQALDIEYNGDALFTLDISTNLPGPGAVGP